MAPPKLGSDVSVCSRPCAPQATKRQGGNRFRREWRTSCSRASVTTYKDSPAIPEIPLRECVAVTISSCVTIVTLLDGLTAAAGVQRHPELFEPFQKRFEAAINKKAQFTELQALIDACMPTSDALMNQQMIKSGKAPLQLMGHWNQRTADAAKKSEKTDAPTKTAQTTADTSTQANASQAAQVKPQKIGPATLEEKFLRNPVDKVIAALTGTYPGWHLYKADAEFIKAEARKYLLARQGDTAGVKKLLSIADALTENKELLRQFNPLKALIKGKTWQLSAKGQDLQQALESGDLKSLKARTLVAALTPPCATTSSASLR
jgi:hypothetical protein